MGSAGPLVWAVPVVAAVVALVVLLARSRELEELAGGLAGDVRRLRGLRPPLRAARRELDRSESLVRRVRDHWSGDPAGPDESGVAGE